MKQVTGYAPVFINDEGFFEMGKLAPNQIEAKRSIYVFEGRRFAGIATVTFEYDPDSNVSGMEYYCDEKLAGRIPCPPYE